MMKQMIKYFLLLIILSGFPILAKDSPENIAKYEAFRKAIPLGGNFKPKKEEGIFVASAHGLHIVVSRDDGKTWKKVFFAYPGGDHGYWSNNTCAYTEGVFAVPAGWGAPGTILASDDGENWRHLSASNKDAMKAPTVFSFVGVKGAFVFPLKSTFDFGKSWHSTSKWGKATLDENGKRPSFHHELVAYGDYKGGRTLVALTGFPWMYSDDLGKSWTVFTPKGLENINSKGHAKSLEYINGAFIFIKGNGESAYRSLDGGITWETHPLGVSGYLGVGFDNISVVGDEVWVTGKNNAKSSKDGRVWKDLPPNIPQGKLAQSDKGTLISVNRNRHSILRSTDGKKWEEVYTFTPQNPKAKRKGFKNVVFGLANKIKKAQD